MHRLEAAPFCSGPAVLSHCWRELVAKPLPQLGLGHSSSWEETVSKWQYQALQSMIWEGDTPHTAWESHTKDYQDVLASLCTASFPMAKPQQGLVEPQGAAQKPASILSANKHLPRDGLTLTPLLPLLQSHCSSPGFIHTKTLSGRGRACSSLATNPQSLEQPPRSPLPFIRPQLPPCTFPITLSQLICMKSISPTSKPWEPK